MFIIRAYAESVKPPQPTSVQGQLYNGGMRSRLGSQGKGGMGRPATYQPPTRRR